MRVVDSAHGGADWSERGNKHIDDIGFIWADCGVNSEYGELKHVLLRRPGKEIENIVNPSKILWSSSMNEELAREQHDVMAETYRKFGIKVDYIEDKRAEKFPNILFMRDTFAMTSNGAIISRLASTVRAGEESIVSRKLLELNIPIITTIHGDMILEGPDIFIVNQNLVFIGIGIRTNYKAAHFVKNLLESQGYGEVVIVQTTYGCGHLDGVINVLNSKTAVLIPKRVSYVVYEKLIKHGFNIIELSDLNEIDNLMSINFVPLNSQQLIINKGCKNSIYLYNQAGIECIEVDVSELTRGGGSVHCMTGVIKRGE